MAFQPVSGASISSHYEGGFRSTGGHSGVDFAAPSGSAVRAAVSGTVISAGWGGAYGNLITVRHNDGSVGYYAHLSAMGVRPGDQIGRGSFIGRVGSTGNSTGPHLHFEVRQDGSPVDPMSWLEGDYSDPGHSDSWNRPTWTSGAPDTSTSTVIERDNDELLARLENQPMETGPVRATKGGGFLLAAPVLEDEVAAEPNPMALQTMLGQEAQFSQEAAYQQQADEYASQMAMQGPTSDWARTALSGPTAGGNEFDRLVNAIAQQESGGSYSVVNSDSGALGKYQIMPANISSWSRAALGYSISTSQFLNDPAIQDRIARYQLGQYYNKYGASGAALAWYAGEGALSYSSSSRNRPQGSYPSMNSYVQQVLQKAGI